MTDFKDRSKLMRRIEELEEENQFLKELLFRALEDQPPVTEPLEFPISREAIDLFEALPQAFTLGDVFAAADELEISARGAAPYVREYRAEEMAVWDGREERLVKTGRKPYF